MPPIFARGIRIEGASLRQQRHVPAELAGSVEVELPRDPPGVTQMRRRQVQRSNASLLSSLRTGAQSTLLTKGGKRKATKIRTNIAGGGLDSAPWAPDACAHAEMLSPLNGG